MPVNCVDESGIYILMRCYHQEDERKRERLIEYTERTNESNGKWRKTRRSGEKKLRSRQLFTTRLKRLIWKEIYNER